MERSQGYELIPGARFGGDKKTDGTGSVLTVPMDVSRYTAVDGYSLAFTQKGPAKRFSGDDIASARAQNSWEVAIDKSPSTNMK